MLSPLAGHLTTISGKIDNAHPLALPLTVKLQDTLALLREKAHCGVRSNRERQGRQEPLHSAAKNCLSLAK